MPCRNEAFSCYNVSMQNLFVIRSSEPEDLNIYEQVFADAGFRFILSNDEDDLLLSDGALLYADEASLKDETCRSFIAFCGRRGIPLLIIHDSSLYPELIESGQAYDAAVLTMDEWKRILHPPAEEKKESRGNSRLMNLFLILFCMIPLCLFGVRIWQSADADSPAAEVQTVGQETADPYAMSTVQVYSISSFGDTVYRGSGYAVTDDGYILTCAHIIDHPSSLYRVVFQMQVLPAEVVCTDPEKDLALLKTDAATAAMPMAAEAPEKGAAIRLIGWPENRNRTVLEGTYDGTAVRSGGNRFRVIFLPMQHGVSGSCVIDEKGRVIGTAAAMDSSDSSIGLIVPLEDCMDFLKEHVFADR